jgi:hypothetical protein
MDYLWNNTASTPEQYRAFPLNPRSLPDDIPRLGPLRERDRRMKLSGEQERAWRLIGFQESANSCVQAGSLCALLKP